MLESELVPDDAQKLNPEDQQSVTKFTDLIKREFDTCSPAPYQLNDVVYVGLSVLQRAFEKWLVECVDEQHPVQMYHSPFDVVAAALAEDPRVSELKAFFEALPSTTENLSEREHQSLRFLSEYLHRPISIISKDEHIVVVPSDYHTHTVSVSENPTALGSTSLIVVNKLPNGKWCVSPRNGSGKIRIRIDDYCVTLWGCPKLITVIIGILIFLLVVRFLTRNNTSLKQQTEQKKLMDRICFMKDEDCDMLITLYSSDGYLCIKRMTIQYEHGGSTHFNARTGYYFTVKIPSQATHIRIWFDVVGGSCVWAVDRNNGCKWLDNYSGREVFYYPTACRREVTFHLKGPSLHCYVSKVEDSVYTRDKVFQQRNHRMDVPTTIFQVISSSWCIKKMSIQYEYEGSTYFKVETGYDFIVKIPSQARHVLIWFDVVGGSCVWAVDRNNRCKWIDKYDGREVFYFASAFRGEGQGVCFELKGLSLHSYVSEVKQTVAISSFDNCLGVCFHLEPGELENQAREAAKNVQRIIAQRNATECVFFIHGYCNDTKTIRDRAKSIHQSIQSPDQQILTIAFEWPSWNRVYMYWADRITCDKAAIPYFKVFLDTLQRGRGMTNIKLHFIAHSMGNRILLGVADKFQSGTMNISLAADVSQDKMKAAVETFPGDLWTHYFCRKDWVLHLSRLVNRCSRAGVDEIETDKNIVDNIVVSLSNFPCHSYLDDATTASDMAALFKTRLRAKERSLVSQGTYFELPTTVV